MQVIISREDRQAIFYIEEQAYSGVRKIMQKVMGDVTLVTGKECQLKIGQPDTQEERDCVVAATVGKSAYLDRLQEEGKLNLSCVRGKREVYSFQVMEEGKHHTLVIAGSDKRGTIYGLFHLSELMGVSPWVYFADVIPAKKEETVITDACNMVSKEPSVKYRGFFINDEWPSFGNWTFKHFGGFTAQMYDHVFELLLRLKGNYLWPAMWTSSFSLDGPGLANAELADEYGIVMSNSHHEPCSRHSEEWDIVKGEDSIYGLEWNFDRNKEGLTNYWRDGLKRNREFENIITIGMRGERDSEILGYTATLQENIDYLKEVITTQNQLIRECVNADLSQVPRMLALYKEVEAYFYGDETTQGLKDWKELDGVTFMLCEDNFGNMRTLPEKELRDRQGGWGMYYHFDYHGEPVSYEWVNSTYLPKVWEQMTMAYEFGIRDIWIVNVGDLKPQELPLSYFMELAYDFDKWGTKAPNCTPLFTEQWVEMQFGHSFGPQECDEIVYLLNEYTRLNSIRKPEALYTDTYHPVHYGEADEALQKAEELIALADKLLVKVNKVTHASFYELVYYPVVASMNQLQMQIYGGKNEWYAKQGRVIANDYADKIKICLEKDEQLQQEYHAVADGKWDGMMMSEHIGFVRWNEEECRYPIRHYVEPFKKKRMIVAPTNGADYTMGGDWTRKEIRLYDFLDPRCKEAALDLASGGREGFNYRISCDAEWLQLSSVQGKVEKQEHIMLSIDRQMVNDVCKSEEQDIIQTVLTVETEFAHVKVIVYAVAASEQDERKVVVLPEALSETVSEDVLGLVISAQDYTNKEDSAKGTFEVLCPYGKYKAAVKAFPITETFVPGVDAPSVSYELEITQEGMYEIILQCAPSNPISKKNLLRFGVKWNDEEIEVINTVTNDYRSGENICRAWANGVLDNIHETKLYKEGKKGKNQITVYACDPAFVLERILVRKAGTSWKKGYMGPR